MRVLTASRKKQNFLKLQTELRNINLASNLGEIKKKYCKDNITTNTVHLGLTTENSGGYAKAL